MSKPKPIIDYVDSNPNPQPDIDKELLVFRFTPLTIDDDDNALKAIKQAIYSLLASEAEHLIFADGIRREALPISKLKELLGVAE